MQDEIGVTEIKTLLHAARLIASVRRPLTGEESDVSVIFESLLPDGVDRKPPRGAESAEPGTGQRLQVVTRGAA